MRTTLLTIALLTLPASAIADDTCPPPPPPEVCFTPGTGCEQIIVSRINIATKSVFVQAYSFTNAKIAEALVRATARGVDVRVILDRSDLRARGSQVAPLAGGGVPTWVDSRHAIAHNKVIIYDLAVVQTGSFNFTNAAEHVNAENAVFIESPALAKLYTANWLAHAAHSSQVQAVPLDQK
jgi:phosphatidylserine/phosphatidylglycerophosphate/cardiolipin synthase-like enzyme